MKSQSNIHNIPKILNPHYVTCISSRRGFEGQMHVGENYILDLSTVHMDCDGDAFGKVYTTDHTCIGNVLLKHFQSV